MKKIASQIYMTLIFIFLYAPIVTLIVFSFNQGKGGQWRGFSLEWYQELFASELIMNALWNTLIIAIISALVSTIIGTISCIGLNSLGGKAKSIYLSLNNIPMLNSELVTGLSLMLVFIAFGIGFGYPTILIAHITFCIPYVILSVMPRLKQTDRSTYEAAVDLGAAPVYAFFKVVFPELMPGILSGFLLAFTMSLDDFIITYFTRGPGINTLSTLIYSEVRKGIKPSMNALSTIMFVSVLILLILSNRKKKEGIE
ncbi:MAG: ABC transporter permease [Candidatus Fimimorpha sp.]